MAKYKQKDLVDLNNNIGQEAVLSKATVIYNGMDYILREYAPLMSKISHKKEELLVYSSQLKILKTLARKLETEHKVRLRAEKKQSMADEKAKKREKEWFENNLPSLAHYFDDLL